MVSGDNLAVAYRGRQDLDWQALARRFFPGIDIVLVEGGRNLKGLRTIELFPDAAAKGGRIRDQRRVALIVPSGRDPLRFSGTDIKALALFIETVLPDEEKAVNSRSRRRS